MKILIENIKTIVGANPTPGKKLSGKEMSVLPCLDNAWISIADGLISGMGTLKEGMPEKAKFDKVINAEGRFVFPSWCVSHTNFVYAGSREGEFVDRIRGLSYEEIARRGGGILNSAERLNKTSEDELFESAMHRLNEITRFGTGAVE